MVRWLAAGLTLVRRNAQRRQPPGVKPVFDPELFRARFALLRRTDGEPDRRLVELFDRHPRIGLAWQALQELYGLYQGAQAEALAAAARSSIPSQSERSPAALPARCTCRADRTRTKGHVARMRSSALGCFDLVAVEHFDWEVAYDGALDTAEASP